MRRLVLVAIAATMGCGAPVPDLAQNIETMVAESGAETVGLTRGIGDSDVADEVIPDISRRVYEHVAGAS